jgi:hypothetical protein
MPRCAGEKQDGTPCERIVSASQTFCFAHDPAQADRRSRNASKAARSKPSRELAAVKERLRGLADEVLSGQVEREAAAVAARILSVYLRAVEQERKLREQEEVLERLEALEQKARQGGQLGWR